MKTVFQFIYYLLRVVCVAVHNMYMSSEWLPRGPIKETAALIDEYDKNMTTATDTLPVITSVAQAQTGAETHQTQEPRQVPKKAPKYPLKTPGTWNWTPAEVEMMQRGVNERINSINADLQPFVSAIMRMHGTISSLAPTMTLFSDEGVRATYRAATRLLREYVRTATDTAASNEGVVDDVSVAVACMNGLVHIVTRGKELKEFASNFNPDENEDDEDEDEEEEEEEEDDAIDIALDMRARLTEFAEMKRTAPQFATNQAVKARMDRLAHSFVMEQVKDQMVTMTYDVFYDAFSYYAAAPNHLRFKIGRAHV